MPTSRAVAVVLFTLTLPAVALANRNGIVSVSQSRGCNDCHSGGSTPTVSVDLAKTAVKPGETITATVTVSNANNGTGGFLLQVSKGTLKNPGPGVKILSGRATHSTPKQPDANDEFVFTVDWTAPNTQGEVTFDAFGNATNDNNADSGDRGAHTSAKVNVCTGPFYTDADGDGFGTGDPITTCPQPPGTTVDPADCDDSNANVNPDVMEVCGDTVDDNCNGSLTDGCDSATDAGTTADGGNGGGPGNNGGDSPEPGGCGCRAGSGSSSAFISFGVAALVLFLTRRRQQA
ncbi:MAG: hypothetical protein IRZ16_01700 [Myxococcaceae bacterium]|nr:hypothetical protein [Myxococcaceae bacterium]